VKSSDVPHLRQDPMPEPKSTTDKAEPKPAAAKSALAPAGESSDPEVHRLLAELEGARLNGKDEQMQDIIRRIADLGFSAG